MSNWGDSVSATANLTIAEKIKLVRDLANIKQEALAAALGCVKSKISETENGKKEYTREEVMVLKKMLGIEGAPIFDDEIADYQRQLDLWLGYIRGSLIDKAQNMQERLSIITKLPYEQDLIFNYRMFESKLLMQIKDISGAEEILETTKPLLDKTTAKNRYHYIYNLGMLQFYKGDYVESKNSFTTAFDMKIEGHKREASLYYNLALCYSRLGWATQSVITLLKIYSEFDHDVASINELFVDNTLAVNYIRINRVKEAEEVLERALMKAKVRGIKENIARALHNYGFASKKSGRFEEAIEYFDQSLAHLLEGENLYLEGLCQKIICLNALKKKALCKPLLLQGSGLSKNDEHYLLMFQSLSHALTLNNENSSSFIEEHTIPHLIEKHHLYRALEFCNWLISHYTKKGMKMKLLEITIIKNDILEKIAFGG